LIQPYHEVLLAELRSAFQQGQTLVLATGADLKVAEKVAQHLRVLHHVVASAFQQGQTLVLATGADLKVAEKVAQHLRVLHHVVASYGEESCVGSKKAQRLCQMFGAENFAYAGNSWVDVAVWRHARKIVLPFPLLLKRSLPLDNRPPEACCSDLLAPYCLSPPLQPLNL